MNREDCRLGQIVLSTQGRDKGRYFVIVSLLPEKRVLVADGKTHKLIKPKKKSLKHLKGLPFKCEEVGLEIEKSQSLQDYQIRQALINSGYIVKANDDEEEWEVVKK